MASLAELAAERDKLRTKQKRRRKVRDRLLDRLHSVRVSIDTGAKRLANYRKRIKAKKPVGLSAKGAGFIAHFEGEIDRYYNDPVGHCTAGIGHLVSMASCGSKTGEPITHDQAIKWLHVDAQIAANEIAQDVHVPLGQEQRDALISFTFNEGTGSLRSSTLLKVINARQFERVPDELARWIFANGQRLPGLVTRRKAEAALFMHGTYV